MTRIEVTLISENKNGKQEINVVQTEKLLSAVRVISTFKPKSNYRLVKSIIEEIEVLM